MLVGWANARFQRPPEPDPHELKTDNIVFVFLAITPTYLSPIAQFVVDWTASSSRKFLYNDDPSMIGQARR